MFILAPCAFLVCKTSRNLLRCFYLRWSWVGAGYRNLGFELLGYFSLMSVGCTLMGTCFLGKRGVWFYCRFCSGRPHHRADPVWPSCGSAPRVLSCVGLCGFRFVYDNLWYVTSNIWSLWSVSFSLFLAWWIWFFFILFMFFLQLLCWFLASTRLGCFLVCFRASCGTNLFWCRRLLGRLRCVFCAFLGRPCSLVLKYPLLANFFTLGAHTV